MKIEIKLCGMTTLADALLALDAGADYIGLIFVPDSPRCVSDAEAKAIIQTLKGLIPIVGIFNDITPSQLQQRLLDLDLDYVQLHGTESPADCAASPLPVFKVISMDERLMWDAISAYLPLKQYHIHALLFDLPKRSADIVPSMLPIAFAERLNQEKIPYFMAGKLMPDTVAEIIETYCPTGVDVASGIELSPGVKDINRLKAFCQAVHAAEGMPEGEPV